MNNAKVESQKITDEVCKIKQTEVEDDTKLIKVLCFTTSTKFFFVFIVSHPVFLCLQLVRQILSQFYKKKERKKVDDDTDGCFLVFVI